MKFRPCIDLHHGQVKQIVGSTLRDDDNNNNNNHHHQTGRGDSQQNVFPNESSCHHNTTNSPTPTPCSIQTNFSTTRPAADFARMYQRDGLTGGHVIMLGPGNEQAATAALLAYPQGLQVGGGITNVNAKEWLDKGASHVIVTSFVFSNGTIDMERLQQLVDAVGGKQHLVLDLSCRRRRRTSTSTTASTSDDPYYVVTDRWQTFTDTPVTAHTLHTLAQYCDEFLVHGVDVEGQQCGILEDLVQLLGQASPIPVTYAGGVRSMEDVDWVRRVGQGRVDLTIGSALDCFGGTLPYQHVVEWHNAQQRREQTNE